MKVLEAMVDNHIDNYKKTNKGGKVPALNHLLFALLDHALDAVDADPVDRVVGDDHVFGKPQAKSLAYERVTLALVGSTLTKYPRFSAWYPKCFGRFFARVVEYQKLEANLKIVPLAGFYCHVVDWLSFVLRAGYYLHLASFDKPAEEEECYKFCEGLIREMSTKDSVVRYVGVRLLQLVGQSSQQKISDNQVQWRPNFVDLLQVFSKDKEDFIKVIALRTVTNEPVQFTESSFSAETAFSADGDSSRDPSASELFGW